MFTAWSFPSLPPTLSELQNLRMFHPRAIAAANNLVKLWSLKASRLGEGQFFNSGDDLMVRLRSYSLTSVQQRLIRLRA